ncbi:MAG: TonB-dependent receptor [Ferruginibacter sp.]|nr:TonB-dependent receptor [Ferruginibacter sp.]
MNYSGSIIKYMHINRSVLLLLPAIFCVFETTAQKDTTKQSINITSSYKPVLRNAVKINFSGSQLMADTSTTVKAYNIPSQNLFYAYQPVTLKPLALQQDTIAELGGRNYIKAGFGNYTTPFVKAGLGFGDGKSYLVNFYGSFISSKGKIKHQDYAQFDAKATGSVFTKSNEIYGSASMGRQDYLLYGYDHNVYDYKKSDVKQQLQDITIRAGIRNTNVTDYRISYNPSVEFNVFTNIGKLNETTFIIDAPVEKKIGESFSIKLAARADLTNYFTKGFIPDNYNFNNTVVQVSPAIVYNSGLVKIHAGITPTWSNSKFEFLPNVYAEVQLKEKIFMIQAGWIGKYNKNTYRNLSAINPYLATLISQTNTKETEFYGGIKASLGNHFNFSAKAGLVRYNDLPFFINDTATDGKAFVLSYEPTVNNFRVHGDLSYIVQNKFTATAAVTFNGYTGMNVNARAWNTVPVEINGSVRWWLSKQALIKADFYMFGGGNYLEKGNNGYNFKPGADLGIGAEFRINKQFTAWIDVNNILNNKYERWHRYEVYGLNLLGGIRFDF